MLNSAMRFSSDFMRRCTGAFFLTIAILMMAAGQTILSDKLKDISYVLFYLVCFIFTFLAALTALLDFWVVRKRVRKEERELIQQTMLKLKKEQLEQKEEKSGSDESVA